MKTSVQISGLRELQATMRKLGLNVSGKGDSRMVLRALHDGARPIVEEAKRLAPVLDEKTARTRTDGKGRERKYRGSAQRKRGAIKANIVQRTSKLVYNTVIINVRNRGYILNREGRNAARAGSPTYWWLVEFGTVNTRPQPFMRPAFDRMKGIAATTIKTSLAAGLDYYLANPANVPLDSQKPARRSRRTR